MSAIESRVIAKIMQRALSGLEKYGTTVERDDLSFVDWLTHLQEELLDASIYIEKLLGELMNGQGSESGKQDLGD